MSKIHVWKTAKLTVKNVWQHKLEWARVLYAPWVILVIGYLVTLLIGIKTGENLSQFKDNDELTHPMLLQGAVLLFCAFISKVQMLINGFRYALLGEGGNRWWALHFNRRFFKLVLYYVLFLLLVVALTGIIGGIAGGLLAIFRTITLMSLILAGGIAICTVLALYLTMRLSLYNLFVAIDQKRPFRTSWHVLKKNVWRFAGFLALLLLPMGLVSAAASALLEFMHLAYFGMALELMLTLVFTPIMLALFTKGASLIYQTLDEKKGATKKAPTPRAKK